MSKWFIAANTRGGAEIALTPDDDEAVYKSFDACMQAIRSIVNELESQEFLRTPTGVVRASEILVIQAKQR